MTSEFLNAYLYVQDAVPVLCNSGKSVNIAKTDKQKRRRKPISPIMFFLIWPAGLNRAKQRKSA